MKINEKEAGVGPFKKSLYLTPNKFGWVGEEGFHRVKIILKLNSAVPYMRLYRQWQGSSWGDSISPNRPACLQMLASRWRRLKVILLKSRSQLNTKKHLTMVVPASLIFSLAIFFKLKTLIFIQLDTQNSWVLALSIFIRFILKGLGHCKRCSQPRLPEFQKRFILDSMIYSESDMKL